VRVLVTGANGFLGRHLVGALAARGDEPVAASLERGPLPADLPFHQVDVRDRAAFSAALGEVDPDAVVHLAALSHVGESWTRMDEYFAINVLGTENVLAAARGRRFLFASSAEVYGCVPESEQPISEERPLAPRSPYALTKAAAERLALAAGATVVRMFNLVGSGQTANFALPSFAAQLAAIASGRREPVLRVGNLEAKRDFVAVDDAVAGLLRLIDRGAEATAYNLASGHALSIREALGHLLAVTGIAARVEIDPQRVRPLDVPLLCGDNARLRALGWKPRHGLDGALADLWSEARAACESAV
jgi:GDP-4-dehydro-6-deoxy-D-mannose reductase